MARKNLLAPGCPVSYRFLAAACLVVLCCITTVQAAEDSFRFVVMGDSPLPGCNYDTDPPENCINVAVLNQINQQIIALDPKPSFIFFAGDMAYYGGARLLQGWNSVMQPLRDAGISVYAIIGNHELYDATALSVQQQQDFQSVFIDMPQNGPAGYEGLAYSFTYGNSFFLIYDTFYLDPSAGPLSHDPNIQPAQFAWADSQTATANANPAVVHKFALSHAPAFSDQNNDYTQYNANLWTRMNNNGFDGFFGAHEHYYARVKVRGWTEPLNPPSNPNPWLGNLFQVISGGAGGPLVEVPSGAADVTQVQFSYTVVDVQGSTVSVNAYSYDNGKSPIDSFKVKREALVVRKAGSGSGIVQSDQPYPYVDCGSTCTAYFNQDATVTLTAAPDVNSVFKGWMGACFGTGPCVTNMHTRKNVIAIFKAKPLLTVHTLGYGDNKGTIVGRPGGINCGATCSAQYGVGTEVLLRASPEPGSTFTGWGGACAGTDEYCTVVMGENQSVSAKFGLE
jgi:uncharacterized repeat protein (TIGR02543 family)